MHVNQRLLKLLPFKKWVFILLKTQKKNYYPQKNGVCVLKNMKILKIFELYSRVYLVNHYNCRKIFQLWQNLDLAH